MIVVCVRGVVVVAFEIHVRFSTKSTCERRNRRKAKQITKRILQFLLFAQRQSFQELNDDTQNATCLGVHFVATIQAGL
jgi:hypothetical protein